jgi:hypothetical protein
MTQPTELLVVLLEQRWIDKNKKIIAYHEVGHAIVGSVLENHELLKNNSNSTWWSKRSYMVRPEEDQMLLSFIISSDYYNFSRTCYGALVIQK